MGCRLNTKPILHSYAQASYQNLRGLYQCTGKRQTLLLPAGKVRSARPRQVSYP